MRKFDNNAMQMPRNMAGNHGDPAHPCTFHCQKSFGPHSFHIMEKSCRVARTRQVRERDRSRTRQVRERDRSRQVPLRQVRERDRSERDRSANATGRDSSIATDPANATGPNPTALERRKITNGPFRMSVRT